MKTASSFAHAALSHRLLATVLGFSGLALGAVGCAPVDEVEPATIEVEEALVDETTTVSIPAQGEVRFERAGDSDALSLVPNAAWREVAPGVFENEAEEGGSRILMGAEGHQWAIDQAEKELADLDARRASNGQDEPGILDAIEKVTEQLANLRETAQNIKAPGGTPQAISCNIGFYNGPSSSISGFYGASALVQFSCSGGCQTFSASTQACTNFGCTPVYSSSRTVCSTPWTFGVSKSGSYGANCSSFSQTSPPVINRSWYGFCG